MLTKTLPDFKNVNQLFSPGRVFGGLDFGALVCGTAARPGLGVGLLGFRV